jgi:PEP-CTERM motif
MSRVILALVICAAALASPRPSLAGSLGPLDFTSSPVSTYVGAVGVGGGSIAIGETFTATTALGSIPNNFYFEIGSSDGMTDHVHVSIYQSNTNSLSGPVGPLGSALFTSSDVSITTSAFTTVNFPLTPVVAGASLTPGQIYFAEICVTVGKINVGDTLGSVMSGTNAQQNAGTVYLGGEVVDVLSGTPNTYDLEAFEDLALAADFSSPSTPEPSTFVLVGIGTACLAGFGLLRRRQLAAA